MDNGEQCVGSWTMFISSSMLSDSGLATAALSNCWGRSDFMESMAKRLAMSVVRDLPVYISLKMVFTCCLKLLTSSIQPDGFVGH